MNTRRGTLTVDANVAQLIPTPKAAHAPARVCREQHRSLTARPIEILIELKPDVAKSVRRVVRVSDLNASLDRARRRVECRRDFVIGSLLPVVRAPVTR